MRPDPTPLLVLGVVGLLIGAGVAGANVVGPLGFETLPESENPRPIAPQDFASTERLVLAEPDAITTNGAVAADPTAATSHSFNGLGASYRGYAVAAEMGAANGSQEELAVVEAELTRLRGEITGLLERERRLRNQVARGELDGDVFLNELAYLHLRSERIDAELESLADSIRGVTAPVTQDNAQQLRGEVSQAQLEVRTLRGPVTERAARGILTESAPLESVVMLVGETGYVLSTIDGGLYLRQSLAAENRQRGVGTGFSDIDEARALRADLYPWTVAEAVESEDIPRGEIYASTINHPHGTTRMFIDSGTERPFRDHHELDLFSLPTREVTNEVRDGLSITIDRTYPGGPAQIVVLREGEPVADAAVAVDGHRVGRTGENGARWFVAPGTYFVVTVVEDADVVSIPVDLEE